MGKKGRNKIMDNCPYCKQQLSISDVKSEEKGIGYIEKRKCIYVHIVT